MKSRFFAPPRPRLFGHRGSAGKYPENTLPSFRAALEARVDYLELDVWATRDGEVMVHHDPSTGRLCGEDRLIAECTLRELRRLDAGFAFRNKEENLHPFRGQGITIPTLEEVLEAFPEALFNIEIKQEEPSIEELTLKVIERTGSADRILLAAENDLIMKRIRTRCGEIPTSLSRGETADFFAWLMGGAPPGYRAPGSALQIPPTYGNLTLVTQESVEAAHRVSLEVHVWTINEAEQMDRLLDLGVDGLMSDNPALLRKRFDARGTGRG